MTRLNPVNINTPEHFDRVWNLPHIHRYDVVRLEQFLQGVGAKDCVLDVGAGVYGVAQYAVAHGFAGEYTAIDFSPEAKRLTESIIGTNAILYDIGDALHMPYADESFDRVCCGELIEHMEDPAFLVAELFRVCRRGGQVIIGTLNDKCDAAKAHGEYPEHVWSFDSQDLLWLLDPFAYERRYWLTPGGEHYQFVEGVKP